MGAENWAKLTTIGCVESQRQICAQTTCKTRYYLLSLPLDAQRFAQAVRGHWGIKNQLHWILDVAFCEDQSRSTLGYSGENLAVNYLLKVLSQSSRAVPKT